MTEAQRLINSSSILQKQLTDASQGDGLQFTDAGLGGTSEYTPPSMDGGIKEVQLSRDTISNVENLIGTISHEIAHVQDTSIQNDLQAATAGSSGLTVGNAADLQKEFLRGALYSEAHGLVNNYLVQREIEAATGTRINLSEKTSDQTSKDLNDFLQGIMDYAHKQNLSAAKMLELAYRAIADLNKSGDPNHHRSYTTELSERFRDLVQERGITPPDLQPYSPDPHPSPQSLTDPLPKIIDLYVQFAGVFGRAWPDI